MTNSRGLTQEQTIAYYDRFGAKQDWQAYYEDIALSELIRHGRFEQATRVIEFGCGTGRFAQSLLADHLSPQATYWGCDVSRTMLKLTEQRLLQFGERAEAWKYAGEGQLPIPDASADRFVSTYVFDILAYDEIDFMVAEARRMLALDGLLCLVSLTNGEQGFSKLASALWKMVYALKPSLVGGCRPIELQPLLAGVDWEVLHRGVAVGRGISSEVIIARKREYKYDGNS